MAKYRLLAPHVLHGTVRAAGTEVGDGTDLPFDGDPTPHMEGLDAAGKRKVEEALKRHFPEGEDNLPGFHRMAPATYEEDKPKVMPKRTDKDDE